MPRRAWVLVAAVVVVAAVVLGVASQLMRRAGVDQLPLDPGSLRVLDEPPDDRDRSVAESFHGDAGVDLGNARLLATDEWDRQYVLVEESGRICLLVIASESVGAACDPADAVRRQGVWLGGGVEGSGVVEAPGVLAVILPDEYADATATSSMEELLRAPNLLVFKTRRDVSDEVVIRSDRYQDIQIKTIPR